MIFFLKYIPSKKIHPIALAAMYLYGFLFLGVKTPTAEEIGASSGTSEKEGSLWPESENHAGFPELDFLEEMGFEKSLRLLDETENYYQKSVSVMNGDDRRNLEELFRIDPREPRFEWEKREIEEIRLRAERNALSRSRTEALGYVIRSMNSLDRIMNPNVQRSERYLSLQKRIYQSYIGLQFHVGNYLQCITMTLNYLKLNPENEKEREPHRILAISYSKQAEIARVSGDTELYMSYNSGRKIHLLKYAEFTYGVNSQEYSRLSEMLKRDPKYR